MHCVRRSALRRAPSVSDGEHTPNQQCGPLLHEPPETLIRGMVPGTLFRFEVEIKDLAVGVLACSPTLCQVGPQALPRKVKQLDVFFRIEAQPSSSQHTVSMARERPRK